MHVKHLYTTRFCGCIYISFDRHQRASMFVKKDAQKRSSAIDIQAIRNWINVRSILFLMNTLIEFFFLEISKETCLFLNKTRVGIEHFAEMYGNKNSKSAPVFRKSAITQNTTGTCFPRRTRPANVEKIYSLASFDEHVLLKIALESDKYRIFFIGSFKREFQRILSSKLGRLRLFFKQKR